MDWAKEVFNGRPFRARTLACPMHFAEERRHPCDRSATRRRARADDFPEGTSL